MFVVTVAECFGTMTAEWFEAERRNVPRRVEKRIEASEEKY